MKQWVTVGAQLLWGVRYGCNNGRYGCTIMMSYIEINKAVSQWLLTFNLCVSVTWPLTCACHIPCTHTPEIIDINRGVCDKGPGQSTKCPRALCTGYSMAKWPPTCYKRWQFPSSRDTAWRNNGSSTRNGSRFEHHIHYLKWRILTFTRWNWKCNVYGVMIGLQGCCSSSTRGSRTTDAVKTRE